MTDVAIVGAGPAGALAALVIARAGFRVRVFDRARFPRAKLCGDTLNPGACGVLSEHLPAHTLFESAKPIAGMLVTGPSGVAVRGLYGRDAYAIARRDLDAWLVRQAADAGAEIEEDCTVDEAVIEDDRVQGVRLRRSEHSRVVERARVVIAADGRHSRLAFALGLARHPTRPRRWAIGAYFECVEGLGDVGEMHVRHGHYIGVAPLPDGLANACLVVSRERSAWLASHSSRTTQASDGWRDAAAMLRGTLARDPCLGPRFTHARMMREPAVLGPMAVDVPAPGMPGLLLAGDAAGFIDPMTGDGLTFALRGSILAARTAIDVLGGRIPDRAAADALAQARRHAFANKWRFNRSVRRLVASPRAVSAAAIVARVWPGAFASMIQYAGDL